MSRYTIYLRSAMHKLFYCCEGYLTTATLRNSTRRPILRSEKRTGIRARKFIGFSNSLKLQRAIARGPANNFRAPFGRDFPCSQMRFATFGRRSGAVGARLFEVRRCDPKCSGGAQASFFNVRRCDSRCWGAVRGRFFNDRTCE